jgi:hypothetical protein
MGDGQLAKGKVGDDVTPEEANAIARQIGINIISTLKGAYSIHCSVSSINHQATISLHEGLHLSCCFDPASRLRRVSHVPRFDSFSSSSEERSY